MIMTMTLFIVAPHMQSNSKINALPSNDASKELVVCFEEEDKIPNVVRKKNLKV